MKLCEDIFVNPLMHLHYISEAFKPAQDDKLSVNDHSAISPYFSSINDSPFTGSVSDITHPKQEVALISPVTVPSERWKNLSNCKRKRIRWWRTKRRWRGRVIETEGGKDGGALVLCQSLFPRWSVSPLTATVRGDASNCNSFYKTCRLVNATGCFPPTLHSSDICF